MMFIIYLFLYKSSWYKATAVEDSSEQHIYTVNANGVVSCFTCDIEREDGGQCLYNDAIINDEATRITVNCAGPDVPQVFIYDTVCDHILGISVCLMIKPRKRIIWTTLDLF